MKGSGKHAMLELTAVIWQEGQDFVSHCPELGVFSCGANLEEAVAMLQEAVDLYIENVRDLEMLDTTIESLTTSRRWTTSIRVAV